MKTETYGTRITIARASGVGVAERWAKQYEGGRWPDKQAITEKLIALGSAPDAELVASVIGNKSWTHPECGVCGNYQEVALEIGPEYSDSKQYVCAECMTLALQLIAK